MEGLGQFSTPYLVHFCAVFLSHIWCSLHVSLGACFCHIWFSLYGRSNAISTLHLVQILRRLSGAVFLVQSLHHIWRHCSLSHKLNVGSMPDPVLSSFSSILFLPEIKAGRRLSSLLSTV